MYALPGIYIGNNKSFAIGAEMLESLLLRLFFFVFAYGCIIAVQMMFHQFAIVAILDPQFMKLIESEYGGTYSSCST